MRISYWMLVAVLAVGASACGDSDAKNNANNENNANNANNENNQNNANNENNANNGDADTFYYEDVKPILDHSCTACHTQNSIGPFALGTYEEASAVAELIKVSVESKSMPPFLPGNDCGEFEFDPRLTDEQIATVGRWVDQGAPMGNPENEGAPIEGQQYEAPTFDTDLVMAEPYTPDSSGGGDDYRCFVIDWPHQTRKFITGFGVVPGEPSIVHHIIAFHAPPDSVAAAEANDAADPGPGYECFGEPGIGNTAWLGSWAPGGIDSKYAAGTGLPIEAGSKIVVQVHYNTLVAESIPDLSQVRFETADVVDRAGNFILWANPTWLSGGMRIPAGMNDVVHSFTLDPTRFYGGTQMTFYGGGLHMHLLGTSIKTWINRQGGGEECLIDIPNWDFNWQQGVQFKEPVVLNQGDTLSLECHWDNSMDNQPTIDGVQITPADRGWGDGSTDEMCLGVYYVTVE